MDSKKITLEELIARKEQSQRDKLEYKEVEVESLGGVLTLKKIPLAAVLRILDNAREESTLSRNLDTNKELIYKCCPLLQDKKLKEIYGEQIAEPYDIVTAVLNDNVGEIAKIADKIMEFYGLNDAEKEIKN